ncbi:MAG: Cys-Gln thioester bond-forming surface protein, partial [Oscillospiraceae bacterium]|nr:Cys-Gln thioester bond-forming surface protein [Oscillospiraceae bacterium]
MHKRILSIILVLAAVLSMIAVPANAASTLEDAMADVNVYAEKTDLNWLTMNGSVKVLWYTYYNYTSPNGTTKEVPAYCVDPELYGVPTKVPEGTPIRYGADHLETDPKLVGIISNGYPHMTLSDLGVSSKQQAYYATKMALWCYLIGSWNISSLGVNPSLTGADKQVAENVLTAAKAIYQRGMYWDQMYQPKLTATPDQSSAYAVTINGEECFQQVFTIDSDTWALEPVRVSLEQGAPAGTKILDMSNNEISSFKLSTTRTAGAGYQAQIKVVYPKSAVEGQTGSAQLKFDTVVVEYKIFYAKTLQRSEYGDIQDYLLDTDPDTPISVSAISNYTSEPTPPPPDEPDPEPEESTLKIIKLEAGTEKPLAGAIFDVWYPDGSKYGSFSTDETGTITLPINVFGNYTVTERVPPRYHLLPELSTQHCTVTAEVGGVLTFHNAPFGSLRVHKISNTGDNLDGVSITIKCLETGETRTGNTGPGGVIEFSDLKPGGYEVRETAGIAGYIVDVEATKTATVVAGQTSEVTFINWEKPGLKIIKYDRVTLQTMENISFEIWHDGVSLGVYKTNPQGEIVMNDLEPGTYLVKEVQTDNGHIADPTPQQIELHAGDGVRQLLFYNDQKPGIHLVKVDSSNLSKVIPNVKFRIEAVDGSYGPTEFTTDVNGEIDLSLLPTGAYVVTELECPDHYIIDNPTRIIQLNANQTAQFVFTNTAKPSIEIVKYDPNTGKYLPGATFRIARIEDGSHYLDRVTDTQGRIRIDDLEPGVYSVQEMSAPSGYILNDTEYHVELFPGRTSELIVNNEKKPDLKIIKTDAITGRPIAGATFTVRKVDSSTLLTETTDANGEIFLKEMDTGVYEITEQSVPDEYLLDPIPQKITLFPNKLGVVQFQDYKKPTLTIKKIDSATGKSVEGARFHIIYASNYTFSGEINDLGEHYTDENGVIYLDKLKDG